jgi:DNA-binding LacI/PurR family transcriptional regulator
VMGAGGEEIPGLTCHQTDWYQMGRTAMQILLRTLENPKLIGRQLAQLPHTLHVGHTTSTPNNPDSRNKVC